MEQKSPEHTSQMGFNPKREPVEPPADEESGDPLMEEQMEMSSVMDSSAERITPSQMSTIWKPDLSRNANDTSSPGKFKICYDQIEKVDEKLKKNYFVLFLIIYSTLHRQTQIFYCTEDVLNRAKHGPIIFILTWKVR